MSLNALSSLAGADQTGETTINTQNEKLPDESSLVALGDIYHRVYQSVDRSGNILPGKVVNVGDAFVVAMCCLAMGSPNRAKAEQSALEKQKLKKETIGGVTVHSLTWKGSKGFNDNRKHILSSMAHPIDKCVNFFFKNGEAARILSSFYAKPNQSLKVLSTNFSIENERLNHLKLDRIPNLFQLGYALGFYDTELSVEVVSDSLKSRLKNGLVIYTSLKNKPSNCEAIYYANIWRHMKKKKIYQLSKDDIVYICQGDNTAFKTLFGFTFNRDGCFVSNGLHKVGELQRAWIKYYTSECLPEFPRSYTHSNNFADMRYALFTMLGSEIVDSGSFKGSVSFFSPVPLSFLDYYFNSRIGRDKVNSIFSKFGYSPSLGFNSHSLRHYSNTLADLSDISPSIITAWSGRVNIKQTDTYIHTDEGFKSEKIKVVMQDEASNRQHIRIRSIEELAASTNLFATETSTGICTQNLNLTPCDYINDFVSQCFLCNEACYIAGDEKAIELLERDCQYQRRRLESVRVDKRLKNSDAMQVWFRVHLFNTSILSSLVELMKEKPLGNTIIYARNSSEFRITDLSSGDRHIVKSRLPDVEKELDRIINSSNNPDQSTNKNEDLSCLLEKFGLSPGDL